MILKTFLDGGIICVDDLLGPEDFKAISSAYGQIGSGTEALDREVGIWKKNTYQNPKQDNAVVLAEFEEHRQMLSSVGGISVYPSGTPVDPALRIVRELVLEKGVAGDVGRDWVGIMASVFGYGPGSGLMFHTDESDYACAFSYYVHDRWSADWGGHFLFSQADGGGIEEGAFLVPKPNRLVIIKAGVPHGISGISNDAGSPRMALSGFFVRPERPMKMIENYFAH